MPSEESTKTRTQVSFAEPQEELKELFLKVESQEKEKAETGSAEPELDPRAQANIASDPGQGEAGKSKTAWTLQDQLTKLAAPVVQDKAIQLIIEICEHMSSGVPTQKLCPENIVLKSENEFSFLGFQNASTDALRYLPPESQSANAEVYALGAILYELLSNNNHSAVQNPQLAEKLSDWLAHSPSWNTLPSGLKQIIRNCLHPDPSLRYKSPADLKEALDNYLHPHARLGAVTDISKAKAKPWPAIALTFLILAGSYFAFKTVQTAESIKNLDPAPVVTQSSGFALSAIVPGDYQGNVGYNFRHSDPVTTTLKRNPKNGFLEGEYVVTEDSGPFTGTLRELSESPSEIILEWNDKYGSGTMVINAADGKNFSGYWTHSGEVAGSWSGSLEQ